LTEFSIITTENENLNDDSVKKLEKTLNLLKEHVLKQVVVHFDEKNFNQESKDKIVKANQLRLLRRKSSQFLMK